MRRMRHWGMNRKRGSMTPLECLVTSRGKPGATRSADLEDHRASVDSAALKVSTTNSGKAAVEAPLSATYLKSLISFSAVDSKEEDSGEVPVAK